MSILINGMKMPTIYPLTVTIYPDGQVLPKTSGVKDKRGIAVHVPPHGRLIDAEKIYDSVEQRYRISSGIEHRCERDLLDLICAAPTIIEAEPPKEET